MRVYVGFLWREKMTRGILCKRVLLAVVMILCLPLLVFAVDTPPGDVSRAADEGLTIFLKDKPTSARQYLGFEMQEDVDAAVLGQGFPIYTIPPATFLNGDLSQDLQSLIVPTGFWQFLIMSGGVPKALLTVDLVNGVWTPVSIGSAGLAREIGTLMETWPPSDAYSYRIIRVYQAKSDFAELSKDGGAVGVVPFGSSLVATQGIAQGGAVQQYSPTTILNAKDLLMNLRPAVISNLQSNR
jgi:hypothetical protein